MLNFRIGLGLLGNNWLYLLDMAKKNVLQPGATVIPAAATLYCMGIEARTGDVCGFDFSSFNKYRWPAALLPLVAAGLLFDQTLDMGAQQTLKASRLVHAIQKPRPSVHVSMYTCADACACTSIFHISGRTRCGLHNRANCCDVGGTSSTRRVFWMTHHTSG